MPDNTKLSPEAERRLKESYNLEWRKALRERTPVKERLKIARRQMPARPHGQRVQDFREVNQGLSAEEAVLEARRCLDCGRPNCVAGCPVGIDIPGFIKLIEAGDFEASARKLRETNSLPAVCGRVCPQETQCEQVCNVARTTGVPVAIGNLERFAADQAMKKGTFASLERSAEPTGRKVAVVGAGPAGLTVAGELAKLGHKVTVFEALHQPGGVLVYGIPEFRLPNKILWAECGLLEKLGVELKMNFIVGKTATLDDLRADGYEAFFIGTGAGLPNFMNIPGENLAGIYSANEYLTRVNLLRACEFPEADTPVLKGRRAAVVGGGNVAMDSVRTALRLGADRAMIIYRRSRTEMPARAEEVRHGEEEGVEFHFLTVPIRYIGNDRGRVTAIECQRMELGEPDASGRRKPMPVPGSEFTLEADVVVVAIGQSPNPLIPATTPGLKIGRWGNIEVDPETMATSLPGVYAGGDIVRGGATVILAMGDGRRAAAAMDRYLKSRVPGT